MLYWLVEKTLLCQGSRVWLPFLRIGGKARENIGNGQTGA